MAKVPTTYTGTMMARAARISGADVLRLCKRLGVAPTQAVRIGDRVFRAYDQAAMDAVVAWRAKKDEAAVEPLQPAAHDVPPAPAITGMTNAVDVLKTVEAADKLAAARFEQCFNRFDILQSQLAQISTAVNLILDALTKPHINGTDLDALVSGYPDDSKRATWAERKP